MKRIATAPLRALGTLGRKLARLALIAGAVTAVMIVLDALLLDRDGADGEEWD